MATAAIRSYSAGWCTACPTGCRARRGGFGVGADVAEGEAGGLAEVVGDDQVPDAADGDPQRQPGATPSSTGHSRTPAPRITGSPSETAGDAAQQRDPAVPDLHPLDRRVEAAEVVDHVGDTCPDHRSDGPAGERGVDELVRRRRGAGWWPAADGRRPGTRSQFRARAARSTGPEVPFDDRGVAHERERHVSARSPSPPRRRCRRRTRRTGRRSAP